MFTGGGNTEARFFRSVANNTTTLAIDVDGDGNVDMQIVMDGYFELTADNFVF